MNILVTGLNGFIGQHVKQCFEQARHTVKGVPREVLMAGLLPLDTLVAEADMIVHLAGASLTERWTNEWKREIRDSRRIGTRKLVGSLNRVACHEKEPDRRDKLFISISAVGIYRYNAVSDEETTEFGDDFLAGMVKEWEHEARQAACGVRTVILRLGVVIGAGGGVVAQLMPMVNSGLAIVVGTGEQPLPMIHVDDVTGFMLYALKNNEVSGVYNMVIPQETDFREFIQALKQIRPAWVRLRIPTGLVRFFMGEVSTVLLHTPHVVSRRLPNSGYRLQYENVTAVVEHLDNELKQLSKTGQ